MKTFRDNRNLKPLRPGLQLEFKPQRHWVVHTKVYITVKKALGKTECLYLLWWDCALLTKFPEKQDARGLGYSSGLETLRTVVKDCWNVVYRPWTTTQPTVTLFPCSFEKLFNLSHFSCIKSFSATFAFLYIRCSLFGYYYILISLLQVFCISYIFVWHYDCNICNCCM